MKLPAKPNGIPEDVEEHIKLMYDLLGAGLADRDHAHQHLHDGQGAQQRRLSEERHSRLLPYPLAPFEQRGQQGPLRGAEPLSRRACSRISSTSCDSVPDGDGTLLDHSLVLYGSGMSDGNSHNHDPLPIVLAGRAGGTLQGNRHLRQAQLTPMSNLLLSVLDKLGCPEERFGDSTGRHSPSSRRTPVARPRAVPARTVPGADRRRSAICR